MGSLPANQDTYKWYFEDQGREPEVISAMPCLLVLKILDLI